MVAMNRDFGIVREALQRLSQFADVNRQSVEACRELMETRDSALEALTRLAKVSTPASQPGMPCDIFWDGQGYYYAAQGSAQRAGGPFEQLQPAWQDATDNGYVVMRVNMTRGSVPARG